MVAQLGNEEILSTLFLGRRESFLAAVGRVHAGIFNVVVQHVIAFHPGTEVSVRHVVLGLARPYTVPASDAFGEVDEHAPPMLGHSVIGGGFRGSGEDVLPRDRCRRQQKEHVAPSNAHFVPRVVASATITGLCGWWQVSQGSPAEWSAEATCGNPFG